MRTQALVLAVFLVYFAAGTRVYQDYRKGRKNPNVQHAPPQNAISTEQPPTVLPADLLEWLPKDSPLANDPPAAVGEDPSLNSTIIDLKIFRKLFKKWNASNYLARQSTTAETADSGNGPKALGLIVETTTAPTTTTTALPHDIGGEMCVLYLDCTARLEAEKVDCINTMLEAEISRRDQFFFELKKKLATNPPLGATDVMVENCFQYAVRHFPPPPHTFPIDYALDVESKRRRNECIDRPFIGPHRCGDAVAHPLVQDVSKALEHFETQSKNVTFERCRQNVNRLTASCMGLRRCCPLAKHCDAQDARHSINATIDDLPEVPSARIYREAIDCLELRARQALPPPPVTLSPLRVLLRKHRTFTTPSP